MDYICLIIVASFLSGTLSGLFGVGGGLVMVPVLSKAFQLMGIDDSICMHVAMGTSLGVIAPTSVMSFMEHRRHGTINMKILKDWIFVLPITTVVTSLMISRVDKSFLNKAFAIFCLLMGILMLKRDRLYCERKFPDNYVKYIWGMVTGFLSGALGVGGGIFTNLLMLFYGASIYKATATSAGVSALIAFPALLVRIYSGWGLNGLPPWSLGFVNIGAVLIILPISILITPLATKLSYMIGKKYLTIGFSMIMFTTSFVFA
ncbi:sulfite exporter TauE/SafE family protein [Candidatus Liberibacter asiaticus]|uniref:sulfite exporter TauE/SafE family protein n=1 Tax=Liberibacter asiaticus TaxID=34021 RepID=UPI000EAA66C6|nr:sulfite exporter TauE/SafE family protein [Candidatus Liberibacter asiaticus]RKL53099.1 sulfite exporter TauE/SafE family protein [Candidatus Liberibacter asiaticus]